MASHNHLASTFASYAELRAPKEARPLSRRLSFQLLRLETPVDRSDLVPHEQAERT
jgi:hypothetical protein